MITCSIKQSGHIIVKGTAVSAWTRVCLQQSALEGVCVGQGVVVFVDDDDDDNDDGGENDDDDDLREEHGRDHITAVKNAHRVAA